jgi:hypothetical protein
MRVPAGDADAASRSGKQKNHRSAMVGTMGAQAAPRLRSFVSQFGDHGVVRSVCSAHDAPFLVDAVDVIDLACDEFIPPG